MKIGRELGRPKSVVAVEIWETLFMLKCFTEHDTRVRNGFTYTRGRNQNRLKALLFSKYASSANMIRTTSKKVRL